MSDKTPRVSVIMTVYNGERHIREAIDSILNQTLENFEFIIVDDASTDGTPRILEEYVRRDRRIRVLRNSSNLGPFVSANRALAIAEGDLIARTDADDISEPERLSKQLSFLEADDEILFVGSSYRPLDDAGVVSRAKVLSAGQAELRWLLRFRQPVPHPSVMFRKQDREGRPILYDESYPIAQDCEFFVRLSEIGRGAIVALPLLRYRTHPSNISSTRNAEQLQINLASAERVRTRDLPQDIARRLDRLVRHYLSHECVEVGEVRDLVAAVDKMLAHDLNSGQLSSRWLKRQSAAILAETILLRGGGFRRLEVLVLFMWVARHHLVPLMIRAAEDAGWLPKALESYPKIGPAR